MLYSLPYFFSEAVQSKSKYLTGAPDHGLISFATEERTAFHRNSCTCSGNTQQLTCTTHRIQPIGRCWCVAHTAGASKGKGACFQHYPLEFTFPVSTEWYTQSQWTLKWCGHEALVKEHAFQRRIIYNDEAVQFTMPVCCRSSSTMFRMKCRAACTRTLCQVKWTIAWSISIIGTTLHTVGTCTGMLPCKLLLSLYHVNAI